MPRTGKPITRRRPHGKSKYIPKKKVCPFCVNKVQVIDYKDVTLLRRFISERGRIEPRRKTGVCARHQRVLSGALKRARHIALLPYTSEHIRLTGGLSFKESIPRDSAPKGDLSAREKPSEEKAPVEAIPEEASPEEPGSDEQQQS